MPAKTPPSMPEALAACVELLELPAVRVKICDGGRGNLGEQSRYMRAVQDAREILRQAQQSGTQSADRAPDARNLLEQVYTAADANRCRIPFELKCAIGAFLTGPDSH